jgi:hypothetical protein
MYTVIRVIGLMQMLDFKMNEKHPCSKPLCIGSIMSPSIQIG